MANKEIKQILDKARDQGLIVIGKDGQKHWVVRHPETMREVRVPSTPGKNNRSLLKHRLPDAPGARLHLAGAWVERSAA